jgi:16S rRNA (uracil1498-N3)-methyltransferase
MHRFFLPPTSFATPEITFPVETARQVRSVLRLKPGQEVICLDNRGSEFRVALSEVSVEAVRGKVVENAVALGEPGARVHLYLGLTQREKFEWMLQKCTEVGAASFTPVITTRSLVQDAGDVEKKTERWQRILQEAAEQSRRGLIPVLRPVLRFQQALQAARRESTYTLIPWEEETEQTLADVVVLTPDLQDAELSIFIGPEGGFSEEEIQLALAKGVLPVTLGPRIMRMETAAVVATALVLHILGEMG